MPSVTVNRADVSVGEVVQSLRQQLGDKYTVEPKTGKETIQVETSALSTCHVRVEHLPGATKLHVHGGGIIIGRIVNEFGIANKVAGALRRGGLETAGGAAPA